MRKCDSYDKTPQSITKQRKEMSVSTDKRDEKNKRFSSMVIKIMWLAFVAVMLLTVVVFTLIYNGVIGYMPPIEELKNPTDKFASVVMSDDGVELGRYYRDKSNRIYVDFDELSPHLTDALVATEDVRFDSHSGIDARGLFRAVIKRGLFFQKNAGGGSTITQQLAKMLYSPRSANMLERAMQKPIEWVIAVKLERFYTKDEIIKMYFNQFDFLNNAVGIKTAAYVYFGKDPKDLNVQESAMLVGMAKNPSYFNPVRFPERTRNRRNVVLEQMRKADMLTKAERDSLQATPLVLDYHKVDHKEGLAPYFREELRRMLTAKKPNRNDAVYRWNKQGYIDDSIAWENNPLYGWCVKNTKPDGSNYNVYTDGLKIYTSIDSRMQKYAENALVEHLSKDLLPKFKREKRGMLNPYTNNQLELSKGQKEELIKKAIKSTERHRILKNAGKSWDEIMDNFKTEREMRIFSYDGLIDTIMTPYDSLLYTKSFLRAGMMSMDPVTGYVKAYVGGPNFSFFQYDMVATGRRQIGSTVKAFLYTYAMEEGYTPCDEFLNEQPVILDGNGKQWIPRNSGKSRIGEMVNLRWALTNSNNWISARLMERLSPMALVRLMHNFGITNYIDPVVSLCLGPVDVSVREMVSAYTAFANKGMRVDPLYVTRITDNQGNVISDFVPMHTEVISEDAYYKILSILLNVVDYGTGGRVRRAPYNITAQMGGKTGTTNFNADGWFMGFTPQLVTGVWVGGDERYIHFNSMAEGQGASMALPIFGKYMKRVFEDKTLPYSQDVRFVFPDGFDACHRDGLNEVPIDMQNTAEEEESIEGVFD